MVIDAHFMVSGLKVTSQILHSTGGDIHFKLLEGGKGVDIKMGVPLAKQTLVSFRHDISLTAQELGRPEIEVPLKFKDNEKEFSICFDQLSPFIGLSFCGELTTPSKLRTNMVSFPLNGPVVMSIHVDREDVKDYHFRALLKDQKPHQRSIEIVFDTPQSVTERHVSLILEATNEPERALRATLKSPVKDAIAEAVLTDNNKEKSMMARFQHDEIKYYGKIGVSVEGDDKKHVYKPLIEYSTPGDVGKVKGNRVPDYHVEGKKNVFLFGFNVFITYNFFIKKSFFYLKYFSVLTIIAEIINDVTCHPLPKVALDDKPVDADVTIFYQIILLLYDNLMEFWSVLCYFILFI